jgi:uncharacterized delta-60 repeat protein
VKRALASALVISTLSLAACAEDDDEAATGSSPSTATTPSATPTPTGALLDSAFGTAGIIKTALAADQKDRFSALALGKDGKLYAAGLTSDGSDQAIAVARFSTDGKPDSAFGENGVATVNVSPNTNTDPTSQLEQARSLVLLSDGSVVAVGTAEHDAAAEGDAAKDTDIVAVRFDSSGKPDADFGDDGVARFDVGTGHTVDEETYAGADQGYGSAALPGGGLVIFGNTAAGSDREDSDYVLLAVTDDGELDAGFGDEGLLKLDREQGDTARHVRVVDDQIVATGYSRYTEGEAEIVQPVLLRASLEGELDDSFGEDGVATHRILDAVAESYQFGVQGDNYVLTGYGKDTEEGKVDLIAYRFTKDGEFDTTFGTDGVTTIDTVGEDDRGRNLVVLPDDRIVYVGSGKVDAANQQAMVVVLSADGQPDSDYGSDGKILTDLGSPGDAWYGVALSSDGKTVYLAGYTNIANDNTTGDDAVLGRLTIQS